MQLLRGFILAAVTIFPLQGAVSSRTALRFFTRHKGKVALCIAIPLVWRELWAYNSQIGVGISDKCYRGCKSRLKSFFKENEAIIHEVEACLGKGSLTTEELARFKCLVVYDDGGFRKAYDSFSGIANELLTRINRATIPFYSWLRGYCYVNKATDKRALFIKKFFELQKNGRVTDESELRLIIEVRNFMKKHGEL